MYTKLDFTKHDHRLNIFAAFTGAYKFNTGLKKINRYAGRKSKCPGLHFSRTSENMLFLRRHRH